ncbi:MULTISPECIES: hypothetical protein [Paenibacillus]|uniref:hypothetical protein n=1 Tax=Paenibacillus TaxID=44249 RepID=UPI00203AF678|nr:hypothetical protein [Paenibacillus camelliae]MCM3633684.1 hypothetical protein [Paenibacillus camelliae]
MRLAKSFILVVVNLVAQLWTGFDRRPEFYDQHTRTSTKKGYILFVSLIVIATFGIITWLYNRIY